MFISGPTAGDATAHAPGHDPVTAADHGLAHEAAEPWDQRACQRNVWVPRTANVGPWTLLTIDEFLTISKLIQW